MKYDVKYPRIHLLGHSVIKALWQIELDEGDSVTLTGQKAPCSFCKRFMQEKANQFKAEIIYQWRENGRSNHWVART